MKRDPDLIRAILLAVEADSRCEILHLPSFPNNSRESVHFHVRLLVDKGLLKTPFPDRSVSQDWLCLRLTWEGYDLLDHIRDPIETLAAIAKSVILAKVEALALAA